MTTRASWNTPEGSATPQVSTEATVLALASHLSWVVGLPVVVPLVVWLIRQDDPWVRGHAAEALNFHLTTAVYAVVGVVLALVLIGFLLLALLGAFFLVASLLAAVAAAQGRPYRYPLTVHLLR